MGRIENPVDYTVRHRGMLAGLLRAERASSGLTYAALEAATGISAATLKRAASGKSIPAQNTVEAFLKACGSDQRTVATAMGLRLKARRDERGGHTRVLATTISTPDQLADGLTAIHQNYGAPSYREMQRRAGGKHMIATSSISRILNRQMLPVDERQMAAFLQGCGMPVKLHKEWLNAWTRATRPKAPVHPLIGSATDALDAATHNLFAELDGLLTHESGDRPLPFRRRTMLRRGDLLAAATSRFRDSAAHLHHQTVAAART
ncbi:helix-turn-helix transcriptional regulator [Streptomyces sp. NPDC051909]|uniref:helix-turn-helix domain-containing protein n=1 Tax=Streptomyces sp. NPDC051909 TaxID=3154944 RepID=UPI003431DC8E